MMTKQYHILNGTALKEQFPKQIPGERIIAKECMVDGSVNGNDENRKGIRKGISIFGSSTRSAYRKVPERQYNNAIFFVEDMQSAK